jgi:hypothetical protein
VVDALDGVVMEVELRIHALGLIYVDNVDGTASTQLNTDESVLSVSCRRPKPSLISKFKNPDCSKALHVGG